MKMMKTVGKPVIKKDAMTLVAGQPVYADDIAPKDCLIVKLFRSPHANAIVKSISKESAMKVPGIEAVYTWEDVPGQRFTMAGQTYPEPSPYDRYILDRHVRYVGDPVELRLKNMVRQGQVMPVYYDEKNTSCILDRCMLRAKGMIGRDEKYPCKDMGNGRVRSVGVAMAMQESGISGVDVGSATVKLNEDGIYGLSVAAADMGTGCDTILAQRAAEVLECSLGDIIVSGADTDTSPYDSGSYASSTTYVTGGAVERACKRLVEKIEKKAGASSMCGSNIALQATESHSSPVSPPPFMTGMAEIELDKETGHVEIIDYAAVVDCGTVINPNLARVQAEGGIVQGIGMALYENIQYTKDGTLLNNSLIQYKIPARLDIGKLRVEFESSYEPSEPFGAKSIGEIVINTPALARAIANATEIWFKELPITSEKMAMGIAES